MYLYNNKISNQLNYFYLGISDARLQEPSLLSSPFSVASASQTTTGNPGFIVHCKWRPEWFGKWAIRVPLDPLALYGSPPSGNAQSVPQEKSTIRASHLIHFDVRLRSPGACALTRPMVFLFFFLQPHRDYHHRLGWNSNHINGALIRFTSSPKCH